MKIFTRLTNYLKSHSNETKENFRHMLSHLVHVALIAFGAAMAYAVWALGDQYGQPVIYRFLVSSGCAFGVVGHGASATRQTTNASRAVHGIAFSTWLVLSLFLAALYMFVSSEQLADVLPQSMVMLGAYVYALAFGIGLLTSAVALVVPSVAERPIAGTLGATFAKYGETLVIVLAVSASSLHLFLFGQDVAKLDLFSTITAMVIADLAFVVAEKRVVSEVKARRDTGRYDAFDLALWGAFGVAVLAYLVLVNIYSVRHTAGTLATNDPTLHMVIDFYGASPTLLLMALAVLSIITAFVDNPDGRNRSRPDGGGLKIQRPISGRVAGAIRDTAASVNEIRDAWRDVRPGAGRLSAPKELARHKFSGSGVPYDATAEFVMPEERADIGPKS
jgi:hypothetical protein